MRAQREKNDRCAIFEILASEIWNAGFPGPDPLFGLFVNGQLWKKAPHEMSPADAIEFMDARLGPLFASFLKNKREFTVH